MNAFFAVNVIFYDIIETSLQHLIHFHILLNSCLSVLEIIKLNKSDVEIYIDYVHSAVVYQKYLTRLGKMIIFSPRFENHQFSQPR